MSKMDEIIVVAPTDEVFAGPAFGDEFKFQGVESDGVPLGQILFNYAKYVGTMRRGDAEENPEFKQMIPYTVLTRTDSNGDLEVFTYQRLGGGGEARLHNKLSIGVGGHMNKMFTVDNFYDVIYDEARREINEELSIEASNEDIHVHIAGLINDDSNDVGKVHLGVLMQAFVSYDTNVEVNEKDQLLGDWVPLQRLREDAHFYDRLESWSQLALEALV
jgi:predicted NUDIX family phosphoesterase